MAGLPRVPGEFSRSNVGVSRFARTGWQRFRFSDAGTTTEHGDVAVINTVVETTGNTVFTYLNTHACSSIYPTDGYIGIIPLKTPEGIPLTFGDPFILRCRIELLAISGDYEDGSDTSKGRPQLAMGIGTNASDVEATSNRHIMFGWRNGAAGAQDIDEDGRNFVSHLSTNGSGHALVHNSAGDDVVIYEGEFFVGPDLTDGSGGAENANAHLVRQEYRDSQDGSPFERGGSNSTVVALNGNQGFNDATGQVYLYASASDMNTLSSDDGDPCVVTCRFWYMVEAAFIQGYGTS